MREPFIQVGILLNQQTIEFSLCKPYRFHDETLDPGDYTATYSRGKILFRGKEYDEVQFETDTPHTFDFELKNVIIGVNFHWERKENQRFLGSLRIIIENGTLSAINIVSLEDYLASVISSEMSATSSEELLKAHAVISRSWLLAQIEKNKSLVEDDKKYQTSFVSETECVRWYDREDHENFDVCADDHCQRYQGITRQTTALVSKVVQATRGEVLRFGDKICDARFSKCCGGVMETFENVWEPTPHPYLQGKADTVDNDTILPDLTNETEAEKWIRSSPAAFCNTNDARVLKQVLNDYDRETADFYRWKITYSQSELSNLIRERSGIDFGEIVGLIPLERGTSGRIIRLKIIGTKRAMTIGKELEIRRTLSKSHLYSSAFVVDVDEQNSDGIPQKITLHGAGWGHGVGLCQIGAAMMAEESFSYLEILAHYFPGSELEKKY